ncbi:MAG TPA: PilC/PilY family type IV pilus protein [Anaeromyxobacteraceae bacterium]|nr:PilC/PilY family type IV pilus protein [Anaeromyxobacteraceae bacterium]
MQPSPKLTLWLSALLLAAIVVPIESDGDTAQCRLATGSYQAQVNSPVAGDEQFFRLPSGPSNVMLLLDNSGSMRDLPQCNSYNGTSGSDFSRTGTSDPCNAPALVAPATSTFPNSGNKVGDFRVRGTCYPATDTAITSAERNPKASWMESVTPTNDLPDPGHAAYSGLTDSPPWIACPGTGSNANKCLFDKSAYYTYGSWTQYSATRTASDVDNPTLPTGCVYKTGSYTFDLGPACTTCMANRGFYFFNVTYVTQVDGSGKITNYDDTGVMHRLKGTFLNANPPKYVTSRFVVKDIAWIGPTSKPADEIRLGLTILDSTSPSGGTLVVPLGPDRLNSFPYSFSSFSPVRQAIIDAVNGVRANGTAAPGAFAPYGGSTPIGSALFNIGQYFAAPGFYTSTTTSQTPCLASCTKTQYDNRPRIYSQCQDACWRTGPSGNRSYWCTANPPSNCTTTSPMLSGTGPYDQGWARSDFAETASGTVGASWARPGVDSNGLPLQCTMCWACQKNSVVVITDGMPNTEISFPTQITGNSTINADYTAACGPSPACGGVVAPKVAEWLNMTELRPGMGQGAKHALNFHTIGFAVIDPEAQNTLKAIAAMGKGTSAFATSKDEVLAAVWAAVNTATPKETSFSAASANSLQTIQTAASDAYLTRFLPSDVDPAWEGHVFQGALFDEFLNGCDKTKAPEDQASLVCPTASPSRTIKASFGKRLASDGTALCDGVYLIDTNCDIVVEDPASGFFVKEKDGVTPAQFPWDAGLVLSDSSKAGYVGASARRIFTWVGGAKVDVATANVATLKPYLNIDTAWCTALLAEIGVPGGTDPTTVCANQVIHFLRGWDVMDFDRDGCGGPGRSTNAASCPGGADGEERNRANDARSPQRFWKLGDVFHSSPAVVTAPIDTVRCDTGYEKQCVATIHSPGALPNQTPMPPGAYSGLNGATVDAYEKYRLDNRMRRRVVLVGANDGMLHAFDAGVPSSCDSHGVCSYSAGSGTGGELWAFIPPDLLPRLKDMLRTHQYMVDGSVMLRDVWVDGGASGTGTKDHVKQADEFHTVAIFGERSGGTQYTALDVTTPDDYTKVKMLWTFPQPLTTDAFYMGQSWADFAPRPPPIGPFRIADDTDARGWSERWAVMIGGGYDPAMTRGRAVFMVDAWSGATLWRYTDDTFKTQLGYSGSGTSMFPVPAAVGLLDIGEPSSQTFDSDGFFDTATWGDLGGNIFVARFWAPGTRDQTSGLVTNWYAARTFEEQRRSDNAQVAVGRSEFYYMTSNAFDANTRSVRTFVGSGNRERLMQQGAACGPDNLLACCQSGCSVTSTTTDAFGSCGVTNTFACTSAGVMTQTPTTSSSSTCGESATCTAPTKTVSLSLDCGSGRTASVTGSTTCDANGLCPAMTTMGTGHELSPPGSVSRNRFYGVWAYGGIATKTFSDQASARTFDANRFTDGAYAASCTGTRGNSCSLVETTHAEVRYVTDPRMPTVTCLSGSVCSALPSDPGWFYEYGRRCPAAECVDPTWNDEKTGSGSSVVLGCAVWSGLRPYGKASGGDPCTNLATPITYGYLADFVSGVPTAACGYDQSNLLYRATQRSTTAPPSAPLVRVTVNEAGKVSYSTLQLDSGAPPANKQLGVRTDLFEPMYWLEVPRDLHNCRHTPNGNCP